MSKILFGLFLICTIFACTSKPEKKIYYIVVEQKEQDIFSGGYIRKTKLDSVTVENDSLAFWEGVRAYTAGKMVEKKLKEKGITHPPYTTENFDVLNKNGISIIALISEQNKRSAQAFIDNHSR